MVCKFGRLTKYIVILAWLSCGLAIRYECHCYQHCYQLLVTFSFSTPHLTALMTYFTK